MSATVYRPMTNSQSAPLPGWPAAAGSLGQLIRLWRQRMADRRTLAAFGSRDLNDVGLSRWDAEHEAAKPFWRG